MAKVIRATWGALDRVVGASQEQLLVCVPFYSSQGLTRLSKALPYGVTLTFRSRISPSEWATGLSSPNDLVKCLMPLQEDDHAIHLVVHQRVHAKAYLADCITGLVGSANLSSAGFDKNFELMLELTEDETIAATEIVKAEADKNGKSLELHLLREWVSKHSAKINEHEKGASDLQDLADVQRELDDLLGYGQKTTEPQDIPDIYAFDKWLVGNKTLAGAWILHDRCQKISHQNLTGHFRQCYYAAQQFLRGNGKHIGFLANQLDSMQSSQIYQPEGELLDDWILHLDNHATSQSDQYDYAVLRGILPPNLGGTRLGGGGGSSTLKRMLPLVARFLKEEG